MHSPVALSAQIAVTGVSMVFPARGGSNAVVALQDVSLSVGRGEFVALLGPSGCGKSTLLNLIAGFRKPTAGTIAHDGTPVAGPSPARTVVFQDYALFGWMSVQRNVEFGLKAQDVPARERAQRARELLARMQLSGFEDKFPHEISGGMKQRAAIARALAPDPDVLLMDEPFGALDAQTRVLLQEEVARLSAEAGKTVLFVTHSIEEAVFLADRVVVMSPRPGRIREEVAVPLPRPRTPQLRADPWFVETVRDLWESLKPDWQKETKT